MSKVKITRKQVTDKLIDNLDSKLINLLKEVVTRTGKPELSIANIGSTMNEVYELIRASKFKKANTVLDMTEQEYKTYVTKIVREQREAPGKSIIEVLDTIVAKLETTLEARKGGANS